MAPVAGPRSMRAWLDSYSEDHQRPINRALHWICVPLIVWSILALLWTAPVPASLLHPGAWAVLAVVLAFAWYWQRSRRLGAALLLAYTVLLLIGAWLVEPLGPVRLRWLAAGVFVLAWIGQFVGHRYEGRRPSFFTDLVYLLIGPAWLVDKLLRRLGLEEKP